MFNVLLVDDENLSRIGLKAMINWEANGFQIVAEATNGAKALEICGTMDIHLVLTDMKMPIMGGIELIERLRLDYPHIKILALSCYTDTSMIRESMRFQGALDYLFKLSMTEESLLEALECVKKALQPQKHSNDTNKVKQNVRNSVIIDKILQNEIADFDNTQFNIVAEKYACICVRAYKAHENILFDNSSDLSVTNEIYLADGAHFLFVVNNNLTKEDLLASCQKIYNFLKTKPVRVSIGVSQIFDCDKNVRHAIEDASILSNYRFYRDDGVFINKNPKHFSVFNIQEGVDVMTAVHRKDILILNNCIKTFFSNLREHRYLNIIDVKASLVTFLGNIYITCINVHRCKYSPLEQNDMFRDIQACNDVNMLERTILDYCSALINLPPQSSYGDYVEKTIHYIEENYSKDIHLEEMSSIACINKSYLSHMFKLETGRSIRGYLTEFRLLKAQHLIMSSNFSLSTISESVGFNNYSHFSKVFKKYIGISPVEYASKNNVKTD